MHAHIYTHMHVSTHTHTHYSITHNHVYKQEPISLSTKHLTCGVPVYSLITLIINTVLDQTDWCNTENVLHWQKSSIPSSCLVQDTVFALGHLMLFTLGHLILHSHLVIWCSVYTWSSSLGHWMQATLGYLQVCFRAGPSAAHIPINVICYLEVWQTEDTLGATKTSKLWWKPGPGSLSTDVAICSQSSPCWDRQTASLGSTSSVNYVPST